MSHLTQEQRYTIEVMRREGYNQNEIALAIDKNKSVVSRELTRNCDRRSGEYSSDLAGRKYDKRQKEKTKRVKFSITMQKEIKLKLEDKYSPEQIKGEMTRKGQACVSHERIYQYIWSDKKQGGNLYKNLRTEGKRYRKRGASKDRRGQIKERVGIGERPKIVEKKERVGDLEIDTIIGKNGKGAIVTINDRAAGLLKMKKLSGKNAKLLASTTIKLLTPYKKHLKTITSDNGKEFSEHKQIAKKLNLSFYFAHPYSSWERGSNENINGLIRQYIPKRTDFSILTDEYVKWVENKLNKRPRKRYNYVSPNVIFKQLIKNEKVALVT